MAGKNSDGSKKVQSTSYILSLRDELLVEILCRLGSSKYATQCKCICKRWFALINSTNSRNSYFLRRWRKFHQEDEAEKPIALLTKYPMWMENPVIVVNSEYYYSDYGEDYYPGKEEKECSQKENFYAIDYLSSFNDDLLQFNPLEFLPCFTSNDDDKADVDSVTPICVLASSKDLVLCCPNKKDHSVYYVCNPFTKQWIALPPSPLPPGYDSYTVRASLVVSDDDDLKFKVVRLLHDPIGNGDGLNKDMVKVEIFSSDDSSCQWRARDISVPVYWYSFGVVSYDGMLVWRSTYPKIERIILFPDDHACANTNANYTLLRLPVGYEEWSKSSRLGVCMGSLRIGQLVYSTPPCIMSYNDNVPKLVIWELNRRSQDWELVHELDFCEVDLLEDEYLEESSSTIANKWWFGTILAFHPRDRDILYLAFVLDDTSMTCLCNVRERSVEIIRELPIWSHSSKVFPLEMPSWPTKIPLLSLPLEPENRH